MDIGYASEHQTQKAKDIYPSKVDYIIGEDMSQAIPSPPPRKGSARRSLLVVAVITIGLMLVVIGVYFVINNRGNPKYPSWENIEYWGERHDNTWTTSSFQITGSEWRIRMHGIPAVCNIEVYNASTEQLVTTKQITESNWPDGTILYTDPGYFYLKLNLTGTLMEDGWYLYIDDFSTS
jgi:hypothetical protein